MKNINKRLEKIEKTLNIKHEQEPQVIIIGGSEPERKKYLTENVEEKNSEDVIITVHNGKNENGEQDNKIQQNSETMKLTERQLKTIPITVASPTYTEGCQKAKLNRTTFYEWLKQPDFKAEFDRQRDEITVEAFWSTYTEPYKGRRGSCRLVRP